MLAIADAVAQRAAESFQPGNVGRRDVRHRHALPARRSLGAPARTARAHPQHLLPDALPRRATPSATPIIPTTSSQEFVTQAAAQGIDIFRIFDSLNSIAEHERRDGGRARNRTRSAKPRSATPATSSIPSARNIRLKYYVKHGQGTGKDGRAYPGHQGHGRPVQALRRLRSWSRR